MLYICIDVQQRCLAATEWGAVDRITVSDSMANLLPPGGWMVEGTAGGEVATTTIVRSNSGDCGCYVKKWRLGPSSITSLVFSLLLFFVVIQLIMVNYLCTRCERPFFKYAREGKRKWQRMVRELFCHLQMNLIDPFYLQFPHLYCAKYNSQRNA